MYNKNGVKDTVCSYVSSSISVFKQLPFNKVSGKMCPRTNQVDGHM